MKIKYIAIALFSLGLVASSCGKKKKGDHKEHTEQHADGIEHDHHGNEAPDHEHKDHPPHGDHDHGSHEGHNH